MHAHGVPWSTLLEKHLLHEVLVKNTNNNGITSVLYKYITEAFHKPLSLDNIWRKDIHCPPDIGWLTIWLNTTLSSRIPNHQMINYNFIHRSYLTPQRLYLMKYRYDPYCRFCSDNKIGTFIHMVLQCPEVD